MKIKGNCTGTSYLFGRLYDISAFIDDNVKEEDNIWVIQKINNDITLGAWNFNISNVKTPQDDESIQILKDYFNDKTLHNKVINNLIFESFNEVSLKLAINLIKLIMNLQK